MKLINFIVSLLLYAIVYVIIGFAACVGAKVAWDFFEKRRQGKEESNGTGNKPITDPGYGAAGQQAGI